jgi:glycosyltransferase involved in cell wall biosynthesis
VFAPAEGVALERVVDGETGVLVREDSVEAFAEAIGAVASRRFDAAAIRRHAEQFSTDRFKRQFAAVVTDAVASPSRRTPNDATP